VLSTAPSLSMVLAPLITLYLSPSLSFAHSYSLLLWSSLSHTHDTSHLYAMSLKNLDGPVRYVCRGVRVSSCLRQLRLAHVKAEDVLKIGCKRPCPLTGATSNVYCKFIWRWALNRTTIRCWEEHLVLLSQTSSWQWNRRYLLFCLFVECIICIWNIDWSSLVVCDSSLMNTNVGVIYSKQRPYRSFGISLIRN
jgi:hypothetical protein